jgi:flagellar motility protein MotE (MotC chaperone)
LPRNNIRVDRYSRIRKWLLPVILLVLIKIGYFFSFFGEQNNFSIYELFSADVSAEEDKEKTDKKAGSGSRSATDNETKRWEVEDDLRWNYDLVKALKERETEIRIKEDFIKKEEERLNAIRREIENRIQVLSETQKRIADLVEKKKAIEDEKMRKLAKVFEATPPEQAGPLMSMLDVDIAAQLLLMMTGRKAGRIWGFVEPDKAVKISKELARLKPDFDLDKISGK